MNHPEKSILADQASKIACRDQEVPLMKLRDVIGRVSEWGKEYPIFLTLQLRTGGLSTALREFGAMCLRAENYELAVDVFLAAVSIQPDDCWLWRNLGCAYQGALHEHLALQCSRRAYDLNSSHADIRLQYDVRLRDEGQAQQAEIVFQQAPRLII
ncbi:hypothetical protein [Bradyrhizobium neotropicale]|uniref:hypothetical protein n=1 Tax=Bradyrhizobium neotropicale TaxID=1497615 RepID=UPI001AD7C55F|nr:hypothetical protein [Bradyrhizobium neotropicale]MBO4226824.1 hypothetical protein [Bradyrhizobium neotropicale]